MVNTRMVRTTEETILAKSIRRIIRHFISIVEFGNFSVVLYQK